jgi:hypothetical protein
MASRTIIISSLQNSHLTSSSLSSFYDTTSPLPLLPLSFLNSSDWAWSSEFSTSLINERNVLDGQKSTDGGVYISQRQKNMRDMKVIRRRKKILMKDEADEEDNSSRQDFRRGEHLEK